MVAYVLTFLGLALIIGGVIGRNKELRKKREGETWWGWMMISFGIAIIAILWLTIGCVYNSYAVTVQRAKVWHDFDIPNKIAAIRESVKLFSKEDREVLRQAIVDGSIEKFNVGRGILGQLNSLREEVKEYNDTITKWQETRRRPVWPNWLYIPEKVNELEVIKIEPIIQGIIPK